MVVWIVAIILFLFAPTAYSLNLTYGPTNEACHTTQQAGTTSLILVPDDVANPETAAEGNTNATILIKAGTYSIVDLETGNGNFIANYNCDSVTLNVTGQTEIFNSNWTMAGLTFDCDALTTNLCFYIRGNSTGWTFRNNTVTEAISAFFIRDNSNNAVVQGNIFESRSGTEHQRDLVKIGDTSVVGACTPGGNCQTEDSPSNITFRRNWLRGNLIGNNDPDGGFDMLSLDGINKTGVVITENYFSNFHNWEQFVDVKNSYLNGFEFSYNTLVGPASGFGSDNHNPGGICIVVGDVGGTNPLNAGGDADCRVAGHVCPKHDFHHNYLENCYSSEDGPEGQSRLSSGFKYGTTRYSSAQFEHNIDYNAQAYTAGGGNRTIDEGLHRQNTFINSSYNFNNDVCTDVNTSTYIFESLNNAYSGTYLPDSCSGTPDWDWSNNVFSGVVGGIDASRLGTGNTTTTIAFGNVAGGDFTITTASETTKGALPPPTVSSAAIGDDCKLNITMSIWNSNGWDHSPMSAVDTAKITVEYDDVGQTISSGSVGSNSVALTMQSCPGGSAVVTFSGTYGWCQDSANIGGPEAALNARCLAVTDQSVTNNVAAPPAGLQQNDFQFYDKFRAEGSGPLVAQNTNIDVYLRSKFTLRFAIGSINDNAATTDFTLWARKNAGAWTEIDTSSSATVGVYIIDHPTRASRGLRTEQMTAGGSFSFASGGIFVDDDNSAISSAIATDKQIEIEYSLAISSGISIGDTLEMRIEQDDGTDLDTYSNTPLLTIGNPQFIWK